MEYNEKDSKLNRFSMSIFKHSVFIYLLILLFTLLMIVNYAWQQDKWALIASILLFSFQIVFSSVLVKTWNDRYGD